MTSISRLLIDSLSRPWLDGEGRRRDRRLLLLALSHDFRRCWFRFAKASSGHDSLGLRVRVVRFDVEPIEQFARSFHELLEADPSATERLHQLRKMRAKSVFIIVFASDPLDSDRSNVIERELYVLGNPKQAEPVLVVPSLALV